jgi:hypothetical protein
MQCKMRRQIGFCLACPAFCIPFAHPCLQQSNANYIRIQRRAQGRRSRRSRPCQPATAASRRGGGKEAKLEGRGRADPPPQLAAREEEGRRCWSDSAPSQELPRRDGGRDTAARVTDRVAARQTDAAKKKEVADDSGFLAIADGLAAVSLFGNPSTKEQHNPSSSSSTPPPRLVAPGTRVKDEEKEGGSWSRLRGERQCNFASPLSYKGSLHRSMHRLLEARARVHSCQREANMLLPPAVGLSLMNENKAGSGGREYRCVLHRPGFEPHFDLVFSSS